MRRQPMVTIYGPIDHLLKKLDEEDDTVTHAAAGQRAWTNTDAADHANSQPPIIHPFPMGPDLTDEAEYQPT
ncbi:MAG: hypothetical protein CM15mP46_0390 [Alphaproteobacteria bacterium]|nr:MAG: hypothetical protein CM15mP46_0390 [Alphaproteobacteria bacterium]